MTGLVIAGLLGFATLTLVVLLAKRGTSVAMMPAAALMLGLAGYAWQGEPGQLGQPVAVQEQRADFDEKMAEERRSLSERLGPAGKWLVLSDGLARSGDTENAANVLVSGVRERPDDPALWVGLANALVSHGNGQLSPAADYAFRRAMALDQAHVAAPYFYGLALVQSGRFDEAREQWQPLLGRVPAQSDLHADISEKLRILAMIEARGAAAARESAPPP